MSLRDGEAAAALRQLQADYPHMEFWTGVMGEDGRAWYGRGREGSPWLVMSDDLDRFRAAVGRSWNAPAYG